MTGREPWRFDPGATGTRANSSNPYSFVAMGNTILFAANDGKRGTEPWVSRGTTASTRIIKDIRPGVQSSAASSITVPSNGARFAWFGADDGTAGNELWRYDPLNTTTALTRYDINPGVGSSSPSNYSNRHGRSMFELAGGILYFRAQRDLVVGSNPQGYELWGVKLGANSKTIGHGCGETHPTLTSTDPVINSTMTVTGTRASPNKVVFLLASLAPGPVSPSVIGATGCTIYVDLSGPLFVFGPALSTSVGSWSIPVTIPNDTKLIGMPAQGQALVTPTNTTLGFDLSEGISVVLGR